VSLLNNTNNPMYIRTTIPMDRILDFNVQDLTLFLVLQDDYHVFGNIQTDEDIYLQKKSPDGPDHYTILSLFDIQYKEINRNECFIVNVHSIKKDVYDRITNVIQNTNLHQNAIVARLFDAIEEYTQDPNLGINHYDEYD
jgi:hypothetical protein